MKIFVILVLLLVSHVTVSSDIYEKLTLENGVVLSVKKEKSNRSLPHAYYDQAVASIQNIFPEHVFVEKRRYAEMGKIQYSIICYKENMTSRMVEISGVAIFKSRAWFFEAHVPEATFSEALGIVLEAVEKLPVNKEHQPTVKSDG